MKKALLLLLCLLALPISSKSQEIEATVTVNMEQLDPEKRVDVSYMERDVQNYLNSQQFVTNEWEGPKIPVDVTIMLSGGNRGVYSARLLLVSRRHLLGDDEGSSVVLRLVDSKWAFPYSQGANLSFNMQRFDEFTSLLDFYMMLIIGMDLDTYGELDGSVAYERAKQIVILGANRGTDGWSTYAAPGEFTRYALVSELTDLRYSDFRRLIFSYFVDGLDMMSSNKEVAKANIAKIIDAMAEKWWDQALCCKDFSIQSRVK